jgi:transcription antitermination factor NusG
VVAGILRQKGYEDFLPLKKVRRRWSDRLKEFEVPMFPGYVFCRFNPSLHSPLITTSNIIRVVGFGNKPAAVCDEEIQSLQAVVNSGCRAEPCNYVREGEMVSVEEGPLRGTKGVVLKVEENYRIVVSVSLLQRSVAVKVDWSWVRPLSPARRAAAAV